MQLKQGAVLQDGKYQIEKILGQGGFGITYLAEQSGLDRKVAIKEFFMRESCNRDSDTSQVSVPSVGSIELVKKFKNKFLKEARTIAGLSHANIIRIYDVFEENDTAYYVMEYHERGAVAGMNLPLSPEKVISYVRQLCSALTYIHKKNMLHLEITPGNILIDEEDNVVLIGFGNSKYYDQDGKQTSTAPGGICYRYAPIEQYTYGSGAEIAFSPATDIYALGATMYTLLTGQTPPEASSLLYNQLSFPWYVPENLASLIRSCMRPNMKERPQSTMDVVKLLGHEYSSFEQEEQLEEVKDDHGFDSEYQAFCVEGKYRDAFELCLAHLEDSEKVSSLAMSAIEKYFEKKKTACSVPLPSTVSYDWLVVQLKSKGYSTIIEDGKLYVDNMVSVEIKSDGKKLSASIENKFLNTMILTIIGVAANVGGFFAMYFCYHYDYVSTGVKSGRFNVQIKQYEQLLGDNPVTQDYTWLLLACMCFTVGTALLKWTFSRSVDAGRAIAKSIVEDKSQKRVS
jgi:serine/threonine protein kinase